MTDLVAWLHRNADACEDQSRWATPELAPFLREAATALEAMEKELADWKLLAKSRGEVLVSAIEQMKEAQARAETAERKLSGIIGIQNMLILCAELGGMQPGESAVADLRRLIDGLIGAERERDEAREALKPFAEAADDLADTHKDHMDIWEAPAAGSITAGNLRAARAIMED